MGHTLDILICTFEREELLQDCISSLLLQDTIRMDWGIIIVNNSPKDFSQNLLNFLHGIQKLKIIREEETGLSNARNTGIKTSESAWVGFLDDDAVVPSDYIDKALEIIKEEEFDCFGGHIESKWKYGRPRWLSEDFGSKPRLRKSRGILESGYNWGSNILIRRSALQDIGGFPDQIGLMGQRLGYGAENIVQIKLKEHSYKIGYDPKFSVQHVVMPQKLKLRWHIRSSFVTGRDGRHIFKDQYGFYGFIISLKNCFSRPAKALVNFLSLKDYYWEHMIVETGKAFALLLGKLYSFFQNSSDNRIG